MGFSKIILQNKLWKEPLDLHIYCVLWILLAGTSYETIGKYSILTNISRDIILSFGLHSFLFKILLPQPIIIYQNQTLLFTNCNKFSLFFSDKMLRRLKWYLPRLKSKKSFSLGNHDLNQIIYIYKKIKRLYFSC